MTHPSVTRVVGRLGSACVEGLPDRWRDPLRAAAACRSSPADQLAMRVTRVIRVGGIPSDVDSFALGDNDAVRMVSCDSQIAARLYWLGETGWEPGLAPLWRLACSGAERVLEVGANIGYYTVQGALAAPHAKYVAVEPHPRTAQVLRENIALNGLENVEVVEAAAVAGDDLSGLWLHVPVQDRYGTPAGAYTSTDSADRGRDHIFVSAVRFRDLATGAGAIKIDAEGVELALLSELLDEIRASGPTLFIEVLEGRHDLGELLASLVSDASYSALVATPTGLRRAELEVIRSATLGVHYSVRDVVLSTDDRLLSLAGGRRSYPT